MMKSFSAKTAGMFMAAALLASTAHLCYAAVSAEGATSLKKQVEEAMAVPLGMGKATGMGLLMDGQIEVTPKDDYYEVKLPSVAYNWGGVKADLGTLLVNVKPEDDTTYKTTMALPQTITVYDPAKKPVIEVKIGEQNFTGIWNTKYRSFTKIDADYKNVTAESRQIEKPEDKFSVTIADIHSTLDLAQQGGDIWSGPGKFTLSQLHMVAGQKNEFDMTLNSINGTASYDKLNLQSRKDIEDKTSQALIEAQKNAQPSNEQVQAMLSSMMSSIESYLNGMGSAMKAEGLAIKYTPGPEEKTADGKQQPPVDIRLASVSWGFDMAGLQEEKGNVSLKFGMDGLSVSNMDAGTAGIIPTASNLEVHFDNLPMKEMSKGLSGLFSQVMQSAVSAQNATDAAQKSAMQNQIQSQVMMAMATIPQQLATAGSKLSIVNTFAKAPDVGTTLDGAFTANAASPVMAQGAVTLTITGLDELIVKLQAMAQGANGDPKFISWTQGLGMLQMLGQVGKAPDGRSQRTYKLEVAADGNVMLNGAPFNNALGAMGGMAPGAPGAPTAPAPAPEAPTP